MLERFQDFTFQICQIQRLWNRIASAGMEKYGLKGSYVVYLIALSRCPEGLTAAELGKICGRDKADVSRAVAVMVSKGLLSKNPASGNLYRAKLELTDPGRALTEEVSSKAETAENAAVKGLTSDERDTLAKALGTIRQNLCELEKSGIITSSETAADGLPEIIPVY